MTITIVVTCCDNCSFFNKTCSFLDDVTEYNKETKHWNYPKDCPLKKHGEFLIVAKEVRDRVNDQLLH